MNCAIVLYFDQPFEEVDEIVGLTKSAELRMASSNPRQDITVLVSRGFDRIPASAIGRLRELRYTLVDAELLLNDVRRQYPFANETRIWRGNDFIEMCFLRFLILEKAFGGGPVLTMDSDVVWRVDPYSLLEQWQNGGSFLGLASTCLVFIKDTMWFEAYRSGFERLAKDPSYGNDYIRKNFTGLYHDQALCQYLVKKRIMPDDRPNLTGHGIGEKYFLSSNPLGIGLGNGTGIPLRFDRRGGLETIDGKVVPFWHMQTSFSRYLSLALLIPQITGHTHFRVPHEMKRKPPSDLAAEILVQLHHQIWKGEVVFHANHLRQLRNLTMRANIYQHFFNGGLAERIFTDELWWKPGVWESAMSSTETSQAVTA